MACEKNYQWIKASTNELLIKGDWFELPDFNTQSCLDSL